MHGSPPELIAIDHDDYHAQHVGHTRDGRQFFLTNPVEMMPGNYMAFFEPWDSGEYDT